MKDDKPSKTQSQEQPEIIEVNLPKPEASLVPKAAPAASSYLPALTVKQAAKRYKQMTEFVKEIMVENLDYGTIPGTPKPTLYKPGAEKLTTLFGLSVKFVEEKTIENWDDEKPLFFYQRKCQLWRGDLLIAEASGSANSNEGRYRWRWVSEDQIPSDMDKAELRTRGGTDGVWGFAYDKRETGGKYGKPEDYWANIDAGLKNGSAKKTEKVQPWNKEEGIYIEFSNIEYRVPNEDIFSLINTILKIAEKRALVAATLIGCNASDFFTQDIEEIKEHVATTAQASKPPEQAERKQQTKKDDSAPGLTLEMEMLQTRYREDYEGGSVFSSTQFWTLVKKANEKLNAGIEGATIIAEHTSGKNTNWREAVNEVLLLLEA